MVIVPVYVPSVALAGKVTVIVGVTPKCPSVIACCLVIMLMRLSNVPQSTVIPPQSSVGNHGAIETAPESTVVVPLVISSPIQIWT